VFSGSDATLRHDGIGVVGQQIDGNGGSPAVPASTVSRDGTIHQMTVRPDSACASGDFTLQTKTPQGKITEFKFTVN
jgi:hypothetical protein